MALSVSGQGVAHAEKPTKKTLLMGGTSFLLAKISKVLLDEAYGQIGIKIELVSPPAFRSLKLANQGFLDGEINRIDGFQHKFKNLIRVPVAINYVEEVVFSKNVDFTVSSPESLKPYSVAVVRGIKSTEIITRGVERTFVSHSAQQFYMLDRDRVDLAITDRTLGLGIIKDMKLTNIKILKPSLIKRDLFHYLHKRNIAIAEKITLVLKQMELSGRIKEEKDRWVKELSDSCVIQKTTSVPDPQP